MIEDPGIAELLREQREQIAHLQLRLAALEATGSPPAAATPETDPDDVGSERRLSRRGLFAATAAGGAGLLAAQLAQPAPAAASAGNNLVIGRPNDAGISVTALTAKPAPYGATLGVVNGISGGRGMGVRGQLGNPTDRTGNESAYAGVVGLSDKGNGVSGLSNGGVGLYGSSLSGSAVSALSVDGTAIDANTTGGVAVSAYSQYGTAIVANSMYGPGVEVSTYRASAIAGDSYGGAGVVGSSNVGTGVVGTAPAGGVEGHAEVGDGVLGDSNTGNGVNAMSTSGYGVQAAGGAAPLRLVPSAKKGRPTTGPHQAGEIYLDVQGLLYLCTVGGTPGTWVRVTVSTA